MKRVIILGNSWHGKWSLSIAKACKQTLQDVQHINLQPFILNTRIFFLNVWVKKISQGTTHLKLWFKIKKNDYCIVITPHVLHTKTWKMLQKRNTTIVAWLGDDPIRKGNPKIYLPFFRHIFVVDSSWIEHITPHNPNVSLLPHAFLPEIFHPLPNTEKIFDVVFVGDSFQGTSEGIYRADLLRYLHEHGIHITLFGDKNWCSSFGQKEYNFLGKIYKGFVKNPHTLNEIYNQSKIVLNIHHRQVTNGANQRIFEASGSKAFQISDKQALVQELFSDSIPSYTNKQELLQLVQYYLSQKIEREEKVKHAHEVAYKHTYHERVSNLLLYF
jgi:spore maturation protein CgeB